MPSTTIIKVDASLNPGSEGKDDTVHVSVSYSYETNHRVSSSVSVPVSLPSGAIVRDVRKSEQNAYEQAAEILAQLADAARKEAGK